MGAPFEWQEAIGQRAEYVESRLEGGAPVAVCSTKEGLLLASLRGESTKLFEVYDRLAFAGIGQRSDIETVRMSAIDFSHQEGFQRSEEDVTIRRVVQAVSTPIKRAFADLSFAPFSMKAVFAEVGESPEEDAIYTIDYDGEFREHSDSVVLAVTDEESNQIAERVKVKPGAKYANSLEVISKVLGESAREGQSLEAALLRRSSGADRAFERLQL